MKEKIAHLLRQYGLVSAAAIWFGVFLFLIIFNLFSFLADLKPLEAVGTATYLLLISYLLFIGVVLIACALFMLNYFKRYKPTNQLKQTGLTLAGRDFPALARGISNLTLGNLTQKLHLHSQYPPSKVPAEMQTLSEILHLLCDNITAIIDDFNSITDAPCRRMGFIGADPVKEGTKSAQILAEMLGNKGEVLVATGLLINPALKLRRKSFESWIRENTEIQIVDTFESMMNRDFSMSFIMDLLESYPKIRGIYATDSVTASIIAEALSKNPKFKRIKVIGHDISKENVKYMQTGIIDVLLDQNPYVQGHDSVVYLYNHLVEGWIPPKPQMLIDANVITPDNLNHHWHKKQGWILSRDTVTKLAEPSGTPPTKPYRIVFLAREDSDIWKRMYDGAMAAQDLIMPQNLQMEWIVPEETREKGDFGAMVYGKYIEDLTEQKVDGIITFVEDTRLITSINKAVSAGIPVMTVNTEPLNLRSLIRTLNEQSTRLSHLSKNLAGTTQHVIISTTEIRNAISSISDGSLAQNGFVEKTQSILDSLLNNIDQISREANNSQRASENTSEAVKSGTVAMEKTLATLNSIANSVDNTWHTVEELRQHSNKIDNIVDMIRTIASKVNILALNASIEATQSGTHEKRFGKVAEEIRKLAMNTTEANREVASLIETIKGDIQLVEKAMRMSNELIKDSGKLTEETDSALDNIKMLVDSDRKRIQSVTSSIHDMQSMSHQVGLSMDQVSMASIKNTTGVNRVNTSIKEMGKQLEYIRLLARNLEDMAQSESEFLAMFETDGKRR